MITRKKKIFIIVIVLVILLLIIIGSVYAFLSLKTDVLKSDQELFYKYIGKNEDLLNIIDDNWLNTYKNKIITTPYSNSGEITFKVLNKQNDDTNSSQLETAINNLKVNFKGDVNLPNKQLYQDIKLLYSKENKELFNVKFLKEDELYGLKSDEVVTKYVSVENKYISQLLNRLGIQETYNIANKIEEYNFNAILNMSKNEKDIIIQKYMQVLNSHIQSSSYTKEKDTTVTVNNEVYNSNKYSVKLTGDELINVKIKLLETLLNDDEILNEFIKIIQKDEDYIKILKGKIQDCIEDVRKQPSNSEIALIVSVYEKDGNLLKTEFLSDERNISIENLNNANNQEILVTDTKTGKGVIVTTYSITRNNAENNNSLILKIDTKENGRQASVILLEIMNQGNVNSNNIDTSINISIKDDNGDKQIKYTNKREFDKQAEIEKLSENTVILNNMTIEYNKNTIQAIQDRLYAIYSDRVKSVGLDPNVLIDEIKYTIKTMKEKFNRDEFEKQVQRSLNYVKQDSLVDIEFSKQLQRATTNKEKQKIKEERLVKRLNEFGVKAMTDEEKECILIDSGYNYNYVYYIDYEKYTVTRAE